MTAKPVLSKMTTCMFDRLLTQSKHKYKLFFKCADKCKQSVVLAATKACVALQPCAPAQCVRQRAFRGLADKIMHHSSLQSTLCKNLRGGVNGFYEIMTKWESPAKSFDSMVLFVEDAQATHGT